MNFSCTQENLRQGLSFVAHGATKNVNLPILNNVLVRIADKAVRLTTTNLEIAVTATVRGKIESEGEFTVPSKLFADYIALLQNDRVDVRVADENVHIESSATKTKIKGIPASEFPLIPKVEKREGFRVLVSDFRRAVSRVLFAVSTNESRPELSGVLFKFRPENAGGALVMAATDSYRLAEASLPLHEGSFTGEHTAIVPARTVSEISRILGSYKDAADAKMTLEIIPTDNQILFLLENVELISRTIEGKYPDYGAVIPAEAKTKITVHRDEFQKAVKTGALFSRSGIHDVHLVVDSAAKKLIIRSTDSQTGENETTLLGEVEGLDNKVTLNHRFLLEGIAAIDTEQLTINLVDGMTPCLLTPKNEVSKYLYIVMPIRQ